VGKKRVSSKRGGWGGGSTAQYNRVYAKRGAGRGHEKEEGLRKPSAHGISPQTKGVGREPGKSHGVDESSGGMLGLVGEGRRGSLSVGGKKTRKKETMKVYVLG